MVKEFEYDNHDPNEVVESQDGDDSQSRGSGEKKRKRKFYPSNVQGRHIVNAVTGIAYPWRVGSMYEDLLWKVCDSTGRRGKYDPDIYFYDSPKQAIDHRRYKSDVYPQESLDWWKRRVATITKLLRDGDD